MKYTKEQTFEIIEKNLNFLAINIIIFGIIAGLSAILMITFLAFREYSIAWLTAIPFILSLYLCIKDNYYYNTLDNIDRLLKRGA